MMRARRETDPAKRAALYRELQEIGLDEAPSPRWSSRTAM